MICDFCFQIIKVPINAFNREQKGLTMQSFCSYECKDASIKDRIEDDKYERKMRRAV